VAESLPFTCPHCGESFGFGRDAGLVGVFASMPFADTPTPCCGKPITGHLVREGAAIRIELAQ
jgi:hypothetical protein